ncbi:MAG: D-aminoacyl-tRNA deacylase [candidate division WOR-3 bacterium]
MKILIQRVEYGKIYVDKKLVSEIKNGFLIFLGIEKNDKNKVEKGVEKLTKIKIIEDENGRFKYSLIEKPMPLLVISQITLIPDFEEYRPDFSKSPSKEEAKLIFEKIKEELKNKGFQIESGIFGEYMEIENKNLGPVSFFLKI